MDSENLTPAEREELFNKKVVADYLRYGSVDEVFRRNNWDIPISFAGFHRLLDYWGVVKAAGPNNKMGEAIDFLEELAYEKIPLERLYRNFPPSFKTSVVTMHRILSHVKSGITRRCATCLVITPSGDTKKILVARDVSTPRLRYGKPYGAFSLPMGFSKKNEPREQAILRVLQQEAFTNDVLERRFPYDVIPANPKPFCLFDLIDVRVAVYALELGGELENVERFSSFKLTDFQYSTVEEIGKNAGEFRMGVPEIAGVYRDYVNNRAETQALPVNVVSRLNRELMDYAVEYGGAD